MHKQGPSHTFVRSPKKMQGITPDDSLKVCSEKVKHAALPSVPHFRTGSGPTASLVLALPLAITFVLTQTLHYSAPEELNCSEQSPREQQVSHFNSHLFVLYFWCEKNLLQLRNPKSDQQRPWNSWVSVHMHTHTHTLSSYFAVQQRLAEDSCLQLSVITFYLFKRYLWMWAKSLYSDPLYFYYLQDEIRAGLLRRTGYTASVGHIRCLRPGTGGHRKHLQIYRSLLHPPGWEPFTDVCSAVCTAAFWKEATGLQRSTRKMHHLHNT